MSIEKVKQRCVEIGECWEWASPLNEKGKRYPDMRVGGKVVQARRYAYEQKRGAIKPGYVLAPHCDNPYCINPAHQTQMTPGQRVRKAARAGNLSFVTPRRIAAPRERAKITMEQAREIRASEDYAQRLADQYGISRSMVRLIRAGKAWKDHANPFAGLGG